MLGVLVVRSVGVFASNAGMYNDRLVQIVDNTFALVDALGTQQRDGVALPAHHDPRPAE